MEYAKVSLASLQKQEYIIEQDKKRLELIRGFLDDILKELEKLDDEKYKLALASELVEEVFVYFDNIIHGGVRPKHKATIYAQLSILANIIALLKYLKDELW